MVIHQGVGLSLLAAVTDLAGASHAARYLRSLLFEGSVPNGLRDHGPRCPSRWFFAIYAPARMPIFIAQAEFQWRLLTVKEES
jgi:hypothetical protein